MKSKDACKHDDALGPVGVLSCTVLLYLSMPCGSVEGLSVFLLRTKCCCALHAQALEYGLLRGTEAWACSDTPHTAWAEAATWQACVRVSHFVQCWLAELLEQPVTEVDSGQAWSRLGYWQNTHLSHISQ